MYGSCKYSSEDYKRAGHKNGAKVFDVLQPVKIHFTNALYVDINRLDKESQKYERSIQVKIAKWN